MVRLASGDALRLFIDEIEVDFELSASDFAEDFPHDLASVADGLDLSDEQVIILS